jgi:two-component system chemotaxis sensor kinase CheA
MNEVIHEFLVETHENLAQLDLDLVTLEKEPTERETLSRVFRTLHTVKGTAGFLGLSRLQSLAHAAENLLSRLRDGELVFNPEIASALLAVVDAVRQMLQHVEATETDGDIDYKPLIETLERLRVAASAPAPVGPSPQPAAPKPVPEVVVKEVIDPVPTPSRPVSLVGQESPLAQVTEPRGSAVSDSSIRVDVGLLDRLMTLVGELVLARNQIVQLSTAHEDQAFAGTVQRLNVLTTELQTGVMKTRMQPISNIWTKFPRIVRDLAVACEKQARIDMDGQETELDKTIIEAIRDPLTHLVRNAIDHGLEPPAERLTKGKPAEGRVGMRAFHEGGKVIIEITDDGRGMDPERIRAKAVAAKLLSAEQTEDLSYRDLLNLVFLPGFSTADRVTQFSGRGVGMDVVRTNVEKIGGSVTIDSALGQGTTIKMKIPLTLAIIPALTVASAGERYAIPQVNLLELVRLEGENAARGVERIHGVPVYRLRGNLLPLVHLDRVLRGEDAVPRGGPGEINIVVLQAEDRQFGLVVDTIHDTEEIVVKPLQKQVKGTGIYAGATIMGDGRVALILDVLGLAQRAKVISGVRERSLAEKPAATAEAAGDRHTVLLFATTEGGRMAIPLSLVDRLEEFPRSAIERVGPLDVVQYRGEILPLIHVSRALRRLRRRGHGMKRRRAAAQLAPSTSADPLQVVVYTSEGRRVGLVVDEILDIAEETITSRGSATPPGDLFTAVVQGRVTEFLDLPAIIGAVDPDLIDERHLVGAEA